MMMSYGWIVLLLSPRSGWVLLHPCVTITNGGPPYIYIEIVLICPTGIDLLKKRSKTLAVVFDDCRQAEGFGDVCVVNRTDPEGRVSLHESSSNIVHRFALDDCRTIAADVAAVGRAALPGSCGG